MPSQEAQRFNEAGRDALDEGDHQKAAELFAKAAALAPDWSTPHYNLGLVHKFGKRWQESLEANMAAYRLDPTDDSTYWNLAIAAGALGRWDKARAAFTAIGLKVPSTAGPWDFQMGLVPIRLNPQGEAEVVWCHRLDPVRARIANIPLPESGHCFGDIVLNDAEPKGYRSYRGREVPVFEQLELLEASDYATFEALVTFHEQAALDDLEAYLSEHAIYLEDWSSSIRMLCRACSEGRPHDQHDEELEAPADALHRLGLAARSGAELESLLRNHDRVILTGLRRVDHRKMTS